MVAGAGRGAVDSHRRRARCVCVCRRRGGRGGVSGHPSPPQWAMAIAAATGSKVRGGGVLAALVAVARERATRAELLVDGGQPGGGACTAGGGSWPAVR
eukprot:2691520-Prymnesium_polylepis.1